MAASRSPPLLRLLWLYGAAASSTCDTDAKVLATYVQQVLRPRADARRRAQAAARWFASWRAARRSAGAAAGSAGAAQAVGAHRGAKGSAQQKEQISNFPAQPLHNKLQVATSSDARLFELLRGAAKDRRAVQTQKQTKVSAATGNGRKLRLRLGTNIAVALQRNERLGRSWRGSWEVG